MKVKIYRINKENTLPIRANETDAGVDCFASKDIFFKPSEIKLVPLGIIAQAPIGFHFKLCLRSSMAKKRGFSLANGVGIIDHKYSGPEDEIMALLKAPEDGFDLKTAIIINPYIDMFETKKTELIQCDGYYVRSGERIAQLILEQNIDIEWDEQEEKTFGGESRGGFGSSGA